MADHPSDKLNVGAWVRHAHRLGRLTGHPTDRSGAPIVNYWEIDFGDGDDIIFWGWLTPCRPNEEEEAAWLVKKLQS